MGLFFGIIAGLVVLVFLVVAHELGHAIAARRNGVIVEEFGIGMPPLAWKKKLKNGVLFSINWLPFGGFVKLQGEYDAADKKGDYGKASFWQKTKILFAGVAVNWLIAVILLTILSITGLPKVLSNQFYIPSDTKVINKPVEIASISKNLPAEKAGLKVGDIIVSIANQKVVTVSGLTKLTKQNKGKEVTIVYKRDNVEHISKIIIKQNSVGGYIGAGLGQRELIKSTWSAPIVGVVTTAQFTWETLRGIGELFGNLSNNLIAQFSSNSDVRKQSSANLQGVSDSVVGPIGIVGTIFPAASQAGLTQILLLTAVISLSLAVMNVLPIPALDGGRWFTMAIFKISKKKLTVEREEKIQMAGFFVMMGLIILVTIIDVSKIF